MTTAALLLALIATTPTPSDGPGRPIILDFTSAHCGPCQQMRPEIERLVRKGYPVKPVDVDQSPAMAERYHVSGVPTFIVVDGEGHSLARTEGYQPAAEIANLYRQARAKLAPAGQADEDAPPAAPAEDSPDAGPVAAAEDTSDEPASKANPKPWETGVRIKIFARNAVGFGSGTIIKSTPEESIILTCAHLFHLEDGPQAPPAKFPRKIAVDLFDGNLRGQTVHPTETVVGEAIDYDFTRDVGLIRIRPGRRLPASPVVSAGWKPKAGMGLTTVGCSQGHDATAWSTKVVDPSPGGDERPEGRPAYQGTLCVSAPKQGRSGGGLYTGDGYVAGVCDFADYQHDRGYYAAPASIHRILARNGLQSTYTPGVDAPNSGSGAMVAARDRPATRPRSESITLRGQSPDRPEARTDGRGKTITLPKPEILGIKDPIASEGAGTRSRGSWIPSGRSRDEPSARPADLQAADMSMDPSVADEPPDGPTPDAPPAARAKVASAAGKWRAVRTPPVARRTVEIDDK